MKHRHYTTEDSLELLLDTMCNMFGGVILMALLVVLQTQMTAKSVQTHRKQESPDIRRLELDIRSRRAKVERLKTQEQILQRQKDALSTANTPQILERSRQFQDAIEQATVQLNKLNILVETANQQLADTNRQLAQAKQMTAEAEAIADQRQQRIPEIDERQLRLPHRRGRETGDAAYFLVRHRKAYRLGPINWHTAEQRSGDCRIESIPGSLSAKVYPVATAGRIIEQTEEFRQWFKTATRVKQYVVLFVYSDSQTFASFQEFKNVILDSQMRYAICANETGVEYFPIVPGGNHETE